MKLGRPVSDRPAPRPAPLTPPLPWFLHDVPMLLIIYATLALLAWAENLVAWADARHWTTAPGVVLASSAHQSGRSKLLTLSYRYSVGPRTFVGHQVAPERFNLFRPVSDADAAALAFPKGAVVLVHHDPDGPTRAALVTGLPWSPSLPGAVAVLGYLATDLVRRRRRSYRGTVGPRGHH